MYQYVLNKSLDSILLIVTVLLIRSFFKRQPKWFNVCLYGIVGLKLLLPDIFKSYYSFNRVYVLNYDIKESLKTNIVYEAADKLNVFELIYYLGFVMMLVYFVFSIIKLKNTVRDSFKLKDNIYLSAKINSPFLLSGRIYLPKDADEDRELVIMHEMSHLKRGDEVYRMLGYLILAAYWFNPLVWLAYHFLCKDIEMAADEKVINELDGKSKARYSRALLKYASGSYHLKTLTFGEISVKERIKNIMNYKKPALWMIISCLVIIVVLSFGFLSEKRRSDFKLNVTVPASNSINNPVFLSSQVSPLDGSIRVEFESDVIVEFINIEDSSDTYTLTASGKIKPDKNSWYKVAVYKENNSNSDIETVLSLSSVELRIEDTVNIFDFRTDYIGDNVKVDAIASLLPYPDNYSKDYIEIKTSARPYELTVHLKGEGTKEEKDFAGAASLAFDLIGNMDVFTVMLEDNSAITFADGNTSE